MHRTLRAVLGALGVVGLGVASAQAQSQACRLPETPIGGVVDDYHGTPVTDPYRWLEDVDAPETREWIAAQNCVTFAALEAIPEREAIRARLEELWNYARYSAPFRQGGRYFFYKNEGLQNQSVLYTQPTLRGEPRVLLDPNTLSEDGTVALANIAVSEDGRHLVYGLAASGSDWREFRVRDVATGRDLRDHLSWIKFSGASWTHDGRGFFYGRYPRPEGDSLRAPNRHRKVYHHRLGTAQSEDRLIYERPDEPEWGIGAFVTDDGRYVIFSISHGTDERERVYYVDLGDPKAPSLDGAVVRLLDDYDASYQFVGNDGPVFYFLTDLDAPRQRLLAVDVRAPERERWREHIPQTADKLESVRIIHETFVAEYLHDAHSRLRLYAKDGAPIRDLELPAIGSVGQITGEPDDTEMFYSFTSYLYPTTIFRYDFTTGATTVWRRPELRFDPGAYVTRQVFFRSKDGTRVPMFLTHRKDLVADGSNPTYLYAYGGFNISITPSFSTSALVWLEMGGVYAVASLRGGGEYGEEWHSAGMLEKKQNVFDDFIAAAEYLIAEKITSPSRLAIAGGSNGGLLVGAVMTQRPELFGAALPAVGVMDMLRYHEFTIGWAWVPEYGSADSASHFPFLYAYSPYHNLKDGVDYPATLVTTADHDDRVVPGHSFKFAARLQAANAGPDPMWIRIETKAGHGAGKPTSKILEEQADRWAFLVKSLGMRVNLGGTGPASN
ncbi:MAG: prolyl oligopeptidase family serine peptidase [Gemmatimonadota bacterium]